MRCTGTFLAPSQYLPSTFRVCGDRYRALYDRDLRADVKGETGVAGFATSYGRLVYYAMAERDDYGATTYLRCDLPPTSRRPPSRRSPLHLPRSRSI